MKVKFLVDVRAADAKGVQVTRFAKDQVVDLTAAGAAHYIAAGQAEAVVLPPVSEPTVEPAIEPAVEDAPASTERKRGRL